MDERDEAKLEMRTVPVLGLDPDRSARLARLERAQQERLAELLTPEGIALLHAAEAKLFLHGQ